MAITANLRKQHAEIVEIVRRIEASLDPQALGRGAAEARNLLSSLVGKLSLHLAMEDNALYPSLAKHADSKVRDTGAKFANEMAGVKPAVTAFAGKWTEPSIRDNAAAFITEAKQLFAVLADRIKRENTELYPLLEH